MKFSDYVVLGSTLIEFDSSVFLDDGCGCFIGMGAAAKTGQTHAETAQQVRELFPWLLVKQDSPCPVCGAWFHCYSASISCVARHVEQKQWTFEQALDYIRSVEPREEPDTPDTVIPVWNRYRGVAA